MGSAATRHSLVVAHLSRTMEDETTDVAHENKLKMNLTRDVRESRSQHGLKHGDYLRYKCVQHRPKKRIEEGTYEEN